MRESKSPNFWFVANAWTMDCGGGIVKRFTFKLSTLELDSSLPCIITSPSPPRTGRLVGLRLRLPAQLIMESRLDGSDPVVQQMKSNPPGK